MKDTAPLNTASSGSVESCARPPLEKPIRLSGNSQIVNTLELMEELTVYSGG